MTMLATFLIFLLAWVVAMVLLVAALAIHEASLDRKQRGAS